MRRSCFLKDQSFLKEVQLIFGLEFQQCATFIIWLLGSNTHAEIQTFNRHYFKKLWKIAIVAMICIPSLLWWKHADSRSVSCTDDLMYSELTQTSELTLSTSCVLLSK